MHREDKGGEWEPPWRAMARAASLLARLVPLPPPATSGPEARRVAQSRRERLLGEESLAAGGPDAPAGRRGSARGASISLRRRTALGEPQCSWGRVTATPTEGGAEVEGAGVGGGHQRSALSLATMRVSCRPLAPDSAGAGLTA
eukprot:7644643-Alexandrium_andersonii.AAC.1